ncbi:fibronectin type III domain-containing protein [Flavobacterium sp. MAH-1]|uniref:Fibronectin type III domain-containing protein n=1 Tax=Flavobacterium agri TaxID=2743471 RepID=A0A7Y8Y1D9_9FLAO|nr:GEVED domain-containing protein [Flavobacterium agri]NUY80790.1 fibronectin type III domain-containing protein [Flavobacterium agri]NYA70814.1 fibronectin type III domain-containing protein [Flavobacterium agri]
MKNNYDFLKHFLCILFLLFQTWIFAQADVCAGTAPSLSVNTTCSTTNYTVTSAFNNDGPAPCSGTSHRDGWFQFTTDATTTNVSIIGTSNRNLGLAIYTACGAAYTACTVPAMADATLNAAVNPNTTYYLRLMRTNNLGSNNMTGTICVVKSVALSNDECSTATPLTVTTSCSYSSYTTTGATASSGIPAPGCASYSGGDVWFSATVPANGILTVDTQTGNITDSGMAFYTGSCGSLSLLSCDDDSSVNGNMSTLTATGLTPGTTVYIRVWAYNGAQSGTFGICATTLPPCSQTPSLITSTTTLTSANVSWTAASPAPASGYQYYVTTSATPPTAGTIPTGTVAAGVTSVSLTGLTANTTYYFWVRSYCTVTEYSSWVGSSFHTGHCLPSSTGTGYYVNNFSTTAGTSNITNNGSGLSTNGYGDFYPTMTVAANPASTVNFSAAMTGGTFGFNIWVDWNNDLDFDDAGEKMYSSGGYVAGATGTMTVPTIAAGDYRMRIRADFYATNPSACGSITYGEAEDYKFTVNTLPCSGNPSNLSSSAITSGTATISWTAASPAPANGYQYYVSTSSVAPTAASTPTGSTGAGVTTANLTALAPNTFYYFWVRSNCGGATGQGIWIGYAYFQTLSGPPTTTGTNICQGGSGTISATASCTALTNVGLTINGAWNAATDPIALQPLIFLDNSPTCIFDDNTANYTMYSFQVSVTGTYTFNMTPDAAYDGMGYIVVLPFTPGVCGSGTWIVGDDDGGPSSLECQMSATLNAGVTYTLISTMFSFSNITLTDTYQWQITGPTGGYLSSTASAPVEWYTASSGGSPIGTGSPFNPVGVAGSGLANTNTAGTYTYYAACSSSPSVRASADFIIRPRPTSVISGSGNSCMGTAAISIALTGTAPWNLTYTDGVTPTTITGIMTSPYTVSVSPSATAIYSVTALTDANCTAIAADMTGNASWPYKTWNGSAGTAWSNGANWTPVGVPTSSDCVVIPNVTNDPIISGTNYTGNAYNMTVLNGGYLQITSGNNLVLVDVLNVNAGGQFQIMNDASLIQVNNTANVGIVTMQRITQPVYRYDYTYWNSPMTMASNYTLGNLSPATQPDKFYSWTPFIGSGTGNWAQEGTATVMDPRKGYIVRAPQTYSTSPSVKVPYTATFTGTPNNGPINAPVSHGTLGGAITDDKWNLLGNPYPSALSAASFLNHAANATTIDGTIYFWTHNTAPSASFPDPFYYDFLINYSAADYASWNKLGGVGTMASSGGPAPNGYVAAGQSFFVKSLVPSGNATFNNAMRVSGNNSQFFRPNMDTFKLDADEQPEPDLEKHRIWLNLTASANVFCQTLVGYSQNATLDWDRGLDGLRFDDTGTGLYSIMQDKNLVIQARPIPFDVNDQVPLGFHNTGGSDFSIRIDHVDGLFTDQNIYLEDKLLDIIHNLKESPYDFTSATGRFDDRFVLRYTTEALQVNDAEQLQLMAFIDDEQLLVQSSKTVSKVVVYDITGKLLRTFLPISDEFPLRWDFFYSEGIYLAKIYFPDGTVVNRKLTN